MNGHKFRTKLHLFEEVYPIKPHETVLCQLSLLQLSVDEKWNIYYKDLMRGWAWKVFRVQWFLGGKQKYCPTNSSAAELYCILLKDSGSSSTDAAADRKGVQVDGLETPTYEESYRSHNALEEGEDNGLRFRDASTFRGTLNVPETDIFLFQFLEEKPSV
ncbi:hypothetical protein ADEAN_000912500 [Angomonas deanei]|uniref:Uncharacterized protein n=1 Tax=Angomonas deanei TaxID=59799 RepID=A0A7G2CT36_9TRYP|nr:hypothetical protein ADEAN_000912500 [Angomonas deanei]